MPYDRNNNADNNQWWKNKINNRNWRDNNRDNNWRDNNRDNNWRNNNWRNNNYLNNNHRDNRYSDNSHWRNNRRNNNYRNNIIDLNKGAYFKPYDNNYYKKNSERKKVVNGIDDNIKMEVSFNNPNNKSPDDTNKKNDKMTEITEGFVIPINNDDDELIRPQSSGNLLGMIVQKMLNINEEKDKEKEENDKENDNIIDEPEDLRNFKIIEKDINTLSDLIELGKNKDGEYSEPDVRYNIDMDVMAKLVEPLENFNNLIGLENIKDQILYQLLFYLQKLDNKNKDMLHTIIEGAPGVGKTELAKLLASVYNKMGILSKNKFKIVKRHDLIGGYLGQTATKTNKILEEAKGGVLFIDEAYSLGNEENKDSYAKECIDTITAFLSENRKDFICIIAGYKEGLEKCFFKYNEGLERRFVWRYKIDDYSNEELKDIFLQIIKKGGWDYIQEDKFLDFFIKNRDYFKFNGGDMETLFHKCKLVHSKRVIKCHYSEKKKINMDDLQAGFELFTMDDNIKKRNEKLSVSHQLLYC